MPTQNSWLAIVDQADLPPVSADNKYYVRFRVVSEDRNRVSHWSPIYSVDGNPVGTASARTTHSADLISIVWEYDNPSFDIFIGFDEATPSYHGTSSNRLYSAINSGTYQVDVVIQVASYAKELNAALEIYSETILI